MQLLLPCNYASKTQKTKKCPKAKLGIERWIAAQLLPDKALSNKGDMLSLEALGL